jgi:gamma-glutamyltranspeptidase/glutathione hydrolase
MKPIDWKFPYPSQRMPVLAGNVVATSHPLAAQAGLQMLREGGTAADAAVATAAAMAVLEPVSNGLGSDAFCLIWHEGKLHGLNASGRAPKAMTPEKFAGLKEMPKLGWDPVTVPGAVSAWAAVSKKVGKLPFEKLLEPATNYADKGYFVTPHTADGWVVAVKKYKDFPDFGKTFLPGGRSPKPGERFANPDQARTLRRIAETKGEAFYRGDVAERIAAAAKAGGGLMTTADLRAHTADWVEPISTDYRGLRLHEIPPNGQGLAALMALGILRHRNIGDLEPDCPDVLHLQIEAMKLAFADAHRYIADPAAMDIDVKRLLDPAYLAERAKLIDPMIAKDPAYGSPKPGGTILLVAADSSGMMVSFIQSNYEGFGSGIVVPGTGIHLQNRGACFTLEEGHPNRVGGGKRPYHTIIPGFVTRAGAGARIEPVMAFGVMGGFMQPQGHLQVMVRVADYGQNPQAALDAPRWQLATEKETGRKVLLIEPGLPAETYEELRRRGHELRVRDALKAEFGRGQVAYRLEGGYLAASDPRSDGQAVGF